MIRAHLAYLRYLWWHKWHVGRACYQLRCRRWLWRALVHDWTKVLPSEWGPYVRWFYNPDGSGRRPGGTGGTKAWPGAITQLGEAFDRAWLHHQRRNRHHWQYHVLIRDTGEVLPLPMPAEDVREMVADWSGAGAAQGKSANPTRWYLEHQEQMTLHPVTKFWIATVLMLGWGKAATDQDLRMLEYQRALQHLRNLR